MINVFFCWWKEKELRKVQWFFLEKWAQVATLRWKKILRSSHNLNVVVMEIVTTNLDCYLKILDFVWQSFYLSLRGDAFDSFLHWFFLVWNFAFNANCFSKMPQNVFWWVSNHQIWTFFLGTILHILHQVLIGSQKLERSLNVIFIFYFYQNLAKSRYKWSLGATRNLYNSKLIAQFTLLSL
jgi:hypothetical protein